MAHGCTRMNADRFQEFDDGDLMIHMQGIISIYVLSKNNFHHLFKAGFA